MKHTFHIPVLGLAFSIDSPLKVAKFGISSVMSIVDDELIERIRAFYAQENQFYYVPIKKAEEDYRAKRITAYLNLVQQIIDTQIFHIKNDEFLPDSDLTNYFELLPDTDLSKQRYKKMLNTDDINEKAALQEELKAMVVPGEIDVNIMAKVDKLNVDTKGNILDDKYADALAALRGFAQSNLRSSVVLSAGMNPRLYNYLTELPSFFPNRYGVLEKRIILKVSDYRSAYIQAKYLAKKGLWVSEFRIESGLNCGGHAFATDGYLLGPILEEFKQKKEELVQELSSIYRAALLEKGISSVHTLPIRFSVQGGIGTAEEHIFLLTYYGFDSAGWGSPFLLVPEATTVDNDTLAKLIQANKEDFYLSDSSPLGVPFHNFKGSTAEQRRMERIAKGVPGSPCTKQYLVSNTEFSKEPVCTASRVYQHAKIKELKNLQLPETEFQEQFDKITAKTCLCEGLAASAYLKYSIQKPKENTAVSICPGPNMAYFKGPYMLQEMIDHIYGRRPLSLKTRPHLFVNELQLYVDYFKNLVKNGVDDVKKLKVIQKFKDQLVQGIAYYRTITKEMEKFGFKETSGFISVLSNYEQDLKGQPTRMHSPALNR
ncbi:hypothetical protein FXV77_16760 [Sphingobacterium phlebotomi]|uniref:Uncharacterized protein n=1 Tax=Sphingobacterium phlebotomi TaxID=2605433 RepID=A0A5D4H0W5_9SPHI|nr:hypothetical protein [Sphingobacterium phlebotomi]TYR33893.1 hypothetical protein FXV77_16760 [Sphingobacterium phlebotomi]